MRKEFDDAMDESLSRLFSMVGESDMPVDDMHGVRLLVSRLEAARGDYGEFVDVLQRLLDRSAGHPLLLGQVLDTASRVAAVYSDEWEPIDGRESPFGTGSCAVPVVAVVGDGGTVWNEEYREKILANARPVFPGKDDSCCGEGAR